jgi:hypothetical protein
MGALAVMHLCVTQARLYELNLVLRGGDAFFRFVLESVQDIRDVGKAHGVNGPIGVAVEALDQLKDSTKPRSALAANGSSPCCTCWSA